MSRIFPVSLAIRTLRGERTPPRGSMSREDAVALLQAVSGERFGDDVEAWNAWLKENRWAYRSHRSAKLAGRHLADRAARRTESGDPTVENPDTGDTRA